MTHLYNTSQFYKSLSQPLSQLNMFLSKLLKSHYLGVKTFQNTWRQ